MVVPPMLLKTDGLTSVLAVADAIGTWTVSLGFLTSDEKSDANRFNAVRRLLRMVFVCAAIESATRAESNVFAI